jgi:murein L,D-transpeptidase YafK
MMKGPSVIEKAGGVLILALCVGLGAVTVLTAGIAQSRTELPRVERAKTETHGRLQRLFAEKDLPFPPRKILLLALKKEMILELWCRQHDGIHFKRVRSYRFCSTSGVLGPKRRQGDLQIPEGIYHIDRFNPWSKFYLSLGINYPNRSDRLLGSPRNPGGDIFIHGECVTIGCIPITTTGIKELYWVAELARRSGQRHIPVYIFPSRMDEAGWADLKRTAGDGRFWDQFKTLTGGHHPRSAEELLQFWRNLKQVHDFFETHRRLPHVVIDRSGKYRVGT